ncbi:Ubiquitinyl hydrolase 1 [Ascochyta rabiei]|uniref:Ubiquitinyl hydrolase n=1 Tax=Didymella rabiei TaxID=5454 RepID=A0A163K753_DIDRA|nr:Ubiquitinyl hydrolase 1 [Ascochyta rabiei]KZM26818.1 ubiquitinyl hydrolase [Ascochyta rabiei]UPX21086.1 Ubiquitinyl hydrolase 1 [Ascochyta rabiei]
MSARDHDIVQSQAADEPATASSPSPPRREPEVDADANFTRKRPRLDDGAASLRAVSTDSESPSKAIMSPHKEMVAMTIREHLASSPELAEDEEHTQVATGPSINQIPTPTASPVMVDGAQDEPASPPVIEIIDDEDENEPTATFTVQLNAEDHFRRFPYRARFRSAMDALREITSYVQKNLDIPHDLLPSLEQWLRGLPDGPSANLQTFYVTKMVFWTDFANLVDKLLRRRYHWTTALAGQDDDMSRYPFGDSFGDDAAVDEAFSGFFGAYMKLCSHLFLVDVHLLNHPRSDAEQYSSPLISEKHLRHLHTIFCQEKIPLFHLLRREHAVDVREIGNRLHMEFLSSNGAQNLLRLADEAFRKVPMSVQTSIAMFTPQLLGTLGWTISRFPSPSGGINPNEYYRGTLMFFRKYTEDLEDPAKITDASVARDMIVYFSALIQEICQWEHQTAKSLAHDLLDFHEQGSPNSSSPADAKASADFDDYLQYPDILPILIANAWKFKLLRKYIVKGRMELRVMSISFMDTVLVDLHREYNTVDSDKHPVLRYIADVLLRGRVVDYIISVDSHPQLISRSGNIVGFLVVTQRWMDSQADAVWNTVSHSPDPRVVAATMTMLRNIVGLMSASDHLYLCSKIHGLFIESFTLDILRFLRELTMKLLDRHPPVDWSTSNDTARPWNVCVRLIQDTAPRDGATKHDLDLNAEADEQLRLLARNIPEPDQHDIYRRCLKNIAERSRSATGSVRVIFILTSFGDITFLQSNEDMVRQILEELPSFVKTETGSRPHTFQIPALQYRLELLALLVYRIGQIIPKDLYNDLWDHVIGQHALSDHARDLAWAQLLDAVKLSPTNEFCRQLVTTYVPVMDPRYYTPGLYEFVARYSFPIIRKTIQVDCEDQLLLQIPGGNLLWSLMLSSPQGTIEEAASCELATRYTQIAQSQEVTVPEVEMAHIELVERCMAELRSAFKQLCDGSDTSKLDGRTRFGRVLVFQKRMLEVVRQKPEFNRARRADSKVESMDIDVPAANAIILRYQFERDRQSIAIAPDQTIDDLYRKLCRATGCTKINLFAGGQKLSTAQRAGQKIADANIGGQLLVQPIERSGRAHAVSAPVAGSSEFETNLVKYFDEMFGWMDADDAISPLLFEFLTLFPYRTTITNSVVTGEATLNGLFPAGKFFQAKYATQAIYSKLQDQLRSSALDETFLINAIRLLDHALLSKELLGNEISLSRGFPLAAVLVSTMLEFLRERPSFDLLAEYFSDAPALANRLMEILVTSLQTTSTTTVTQECYDTITEASLCSSAVWQTFWTHPQVAHVHRVLLLLDERESLREHIKLKILSICGGDLPSSCPLDRADIASHYWVAIANILPEVANKSEQSVQLFQLAEHVFRAHDEHNRSEETLRSLLHSWSSSLLAHEHSEIPGRYKVDNVVLGFTKLLLCLIPSLKSYKRPLNAGALISSIFEKFLFTRRTLSIKSTAHEDDCASTSLPILDSNTRRELYDLMLALVDDSHSYDCLLQLSSEVENKEVDNIMPGVSVDRSVEIRSQTGYVGLHNPRAICYMNSLLTQLFMNMDFRQFMLGIEVKDGNGSQRLLLETQKLFATMQNSYRKAADPRPFAACVRTLDKTPIDIGVQMDADEFYNLLFDQWEAQLVSELDKRRFRSFYGGQMLQQVKSKECEHISERADSFFALPCDVQGKANLQESLQSFVQGDVMEGDNKYKCESCGGKFVDAVKRTCLKTAPDNLIFHLKRFDFDLTDFSRRKVHEHFGFPEAIDIGLYNVEHLGDPTKPHTEDFFDLVGVVVHFGNCENGHYYSYIRKRPRPTGDASPTWLNFNDQEVDPFDPAEIPQKTFGGATDDGYNRQYKLYSAYMLFYQRRTAIENDQQRWAVSSQAQPPKVEIPRSIEHDIDLENELFLREYCILDPYHSAFVRQLNNTSRRISHGMCSEDHVQEATALDIFLAHLSRVVWRQQITSIFEEALVHLRRSALSCEVCCNIVLQWLARDEEGLHNLLLRCPHASIRSQTRSLLVDSLKFLRGKDPALYGVSGTDSDTDSDSAAIGAGTLSIVAKRFVTLVEGSYRSARAWDDLYLALTQIAEMGSSETAALLDVGVLDLCLQLFCMHAHVRVAEERTEFVRVLEKRKSIYNRLVGFVFTVLLRMDINLPVCDGSDRFAKIDQEQMRFPLTRQEKSLLLWWHVDMKAFAVVDKMVELFDPTKTECFYPGEVVKWMATSLDDQVQRRILIMIVQGITELNTPYCDAYLRVASCYCEVVTNVDSLGKICDTVVATVATIEQPSDENCVPGGENILFFFRDLCRMTNPFVSAADVSWCLLDKSDRFAIPLLLYSEEVVRKGAHDFVRGLYTKHMEDPQNLDEAYKCARATAAEIIKKVSHESSSGTPRSYLGPMLETGNFLIEMLHTLDKSEDPNFVTLKDTNDKALIFQWQIEVESRVNMLPENSTPISMGEGVFDQSDYGSESDDVELLDS